jgi:hypothetical protein
MTTKQFIAIFAFIIILSGTYMYDNMSSRKARNRCANYAMPIVLRTFEGSMVETGDEFPPKRLSADASIAAKANYDFFFDFCMDNWEDAKW